MQTIKKASRTDRRTDRQTENNIPFSLGIMTHFQTLFLTKILTIAKNWGCHDMLLINCFHVTEVSFVCVENLWRSYAHQKQRNHEMTIFRRYFWRRYWRYRKTEGAMTCYSSIAFMWYRFRSCVLKTLGGVSRTNATQSVSERQTDRQTNWKQYPRLGDNKDKWKKWPRAHKYKLIY